MPVRTNHSLYRRSRAVLELENDAAAFFVLNKLQAFIEICAFGRPAFDELVEENARCVRFACYLVSLGHRSFRLHACPCPGRAGSYR